MSTGRYTDYDTRTDPFSDRGNARDGFDRGGQDFNHYVPGNRSSNDIPLSSSQSNHSAYTGVPRSDFEADLAASGPYFGQPAGPRFLGMERYSDPQMAQKAGIYSSIRESTSVLDSGPSPWLQQQQRREKRSKWLIWGGVIVVLGLIIVAIVVGVIVSKNNKKNNSSSTSPTKGVVKQDDPNDPSTFVKDPNLHQAFYGMAYTPEGSQMPWCGNSLDAVITDIQLISQLTKRIRLYGADCNQTALVLEAIKRTKVDMQVWLGNYVIPTDNGAAYNRQKAVIKSALETYGTDHVAGITVGNEFMLNYVGANGGGSADVNTALGDRGAAILINNIQDTRDMLASMGLSHIQVGNSDAGSFFNTKVLEAVDYGMANVHPWFANTTAEAAAKWTTDFFQETNVDAAALLPNKPHMYIAETGWPTQSSDAGNANNGASTASIANLQIFLDTFVCQANAAGTGYFFFEFFDEKWKDDMYGGVEGWWGLFTENRKLKSGIKIPDCIAP